MFISKSKTFQDSFKPLLYFNCFIGMGAFREPSQNRATYFFMMIHTFTSKLITWTTIYVTFNSFAEVTDFDNGSPMALVMYKVLITVNSCTAVIAPFLVWLRRKGLWDCFEQMLILDGTFKAVLGARIEYRKQYIRLIWQIVTIFLVMCLVGISDVVSILKVPSNMDIRSVFTFYSVAHTLHYPILVMLVLDLNFCSFVGYLGSKFRDLNDSLLGLTEKPFSPFPGKELFVISRKVFRMSPENTVETTKSEGWINDRHYLLRKIRQIHLDLCKLSQEINLAFGIQNLLSTGISFVMITGLVYTIYSALESQYLAHNTIPNEVISSAVWTAIYASKIWIVNHSCWSVSNEALKTGEVIYELLNSKMDKELQKEIQQFGVQMLQNPVNFNACGFFTLDYTFVQGVIGSITTYLVILIQMSNSSRPISSTSWLNNTET